MRKSTFFTKNHIVHKEFFFSLSTMTLRSRIGGKAGKDTVLIYNKKKNNKLYIYIAFPLCIKYGSSLRSI